MGDVQTILAINWSRKPKWQTKMFDDFGRTCALSGNKNNITIDHILPRMPGRKRNHKGNLLPLTINLNSSKGQQNLFDWFYANRERLNLSEEKFIVAIKYLAEQNGMSMWEYYVHYQSEYKEYLIYKESVTK